MRFELDFETVFQETSGGIPFRHQLRAIVPVRFSFVPGPDGTGNADFVYSSVTYTGPSFAPCALTATGINSVFQVLDTRIDLNVFEGNSPPPQALVMEYDRGDPNFGTTITCPTVPPVISPPLPWWRPAYEDHHFGELSGSGFFATDWDRVGGGIYARKTYQTTSADAEEITIMNLKHTPQ